MVRPAPRESSAPPRDPATADLGIPPGLRAEVDPDGSLRLSYELGAPAPCGALTPAEREVAAALLRGWSFGRIAAERGATPRTVANQAQAIYRKLGAASRLELAARTREAHGRIARQEGAEAAWRALLDGDWTVSEAAAHGGRMHLRGRRVASGARKTPLLTPRERRVLALRAAARTLKLIAAELGVSEATVSRALVCGMRKLGLSCATELVLFGADRP